MKKLALIIIAGVLLGGCNRLDVHQPLTVKKVFLYPARSVSQSFLSRYSNLNIVKICLRNPDRLLTPMTFTLRNAATPESPLRTINFNGGNIDNQDCTKFQFAPLPGSQGRSYLAQIDVEDIIVAGKRQSHNLYLEVNTDSEYPDGTAFLDEKPLNYDLHFKTFYQQPLSAVIQESFSQFLARLPLDPAFILPYVLLLGYLFFRLVRS